MSIKGTKTHQNLKDEFRTISPAIHRCRMSAKNPAKCLR